MGRSADGAKARSARATQRLARVLRVREGVGGDRSRVREVVGGRGPKLKNSHFWASRVFWGKRLETYLVRGVSPFRSPYDIYLTVRCTRTFYTHHTYYCAQRYHVHQCVVSTADLSLTVTQLAAVS